MAAGKNQHQQQPEGVVAAAAAEPSVARRLWRVVRAVLYMLRRGLPSGRKLAMDLHLLLHRGKIAGKALGDRFLASHHGHGRGHGFSYAAGASASAAGPLSFSCGALDPSLAVHEPSRRRREVEFSCSNTPSSATGGVGGRGGGGLGLLGAARRRRRRHRSSRPQQLQQEEVDEVEAADSNRYLMQYYDAAVVARVFEMLSDDDDDVPAPAPGVSSAATPSPAAAGSARQRQQQQAARVDLLAASGSSPADGGAQVDRRADEFIRRFYEQLRAQRSAASTPTPTPDCYGGYAGPGASPYGAPRRVTAGIA